MTREYYLKEVTSISTDTLCYFIAELPKYDEMKTQNADNYLSEKLKGALSEGIKIRDGLSNMSAIINNGANDSDLQQLIGFAVHAHLSITDCLKIIKDILSEKKGLNNRLAGVQGEKNRLEGERNEWRRKFNDKNKDCEDYKEKYENALKEIDRLKNEKINENRRHNDAILSKERENSTIRVEKTREEEQKNAANNQVIDLSRRLENKEEELSVARREKENQEITLLTKIDQKQQLLENVRQSLADLRVENEREKAEKDIEINEKNSQLKEKETELKRKEEEIKNLRSQKGLSQEELLNEKLNSEKSNLELLANELRVNLEQINSLTKYHERLLVAQKGHNQANIDIHEANISRVKQELTDQEISVVHIQEICRKCKRIAELHWELEQSQQQFQAQQEVPTNNNF